MALQDEVDVVFFQDVQPGSAQGALSQSGMLEKSGWWKVTTVQGWGLASRVCSSHWACSCSHWSGFRGAASRWLELRVMKRTPWWSVWPREEARSVPPVRGPLAGPAPSVMSVCRSPKARKVKGWASREAVVKVCQEPVRPVPLLRR